MTIHTFGAYFGLILSWSSYRPHLKSKHRQGSTPTSPDLFAMIGEASRGVVGKGPVYIQDIWSCGATYKSWGSGRELPSNGLFHQSLRTVAYHFCSSFMTGS